MPDSLERKRKRSLDHYYAHREELIAAQHEYRQRTRLEVFQAYGNRCVCCGEATTLFLTIDHINGNGNAHRKSINRSSGAGFYSWLKQHNYPPEFQLMCYNCNMGRQRNGGTCPHKGKEPDNE